MYIYHIKWSSLTAVNSYSNPHTKALHLNCIHAHILRTHTHMHTRAHTYTHAHTITHAHTNTYIHTYIFDICEGWQICFNPFTTVDTIWHLGVIIWDLVAITHPEIKSVYSMQFYYACCHLVLL